MKWLVLLAVSLVLILAYHVYARIRRRRRAERLARGQPDTRVDTGRAENSGILEYLENTNDGAPPTLALEKTPEALRRQLKDTVRRGTESETLELLWDEWNASLPEDCRAIVYGRPVLVHPQTGIVFALAGGRAAFFARLPKEEVEE